MVRDTDSFDRRTVLKTVTSAALVGGGFAASTGGGAAARTASGVAGAYADESALRGAFERHGDDLRETLVAEGFVGDDFAFADLALDLDAGVSGLEPTDADRLAGVTAVREGGTRTALGMASTSSDTHEVALYVQPQRGVAYARVTPKSGGDTYLVSGDGVTPEGCEYTECVDEGDCTASYCYTKRKYYSCDSNCRNCSVYKTDCSCCVCDSDEC